MKKLILTFLTLMVALVSTAQSISVTWSLSDNANLNQTTLSGDEAALSYVTNSYMTGSEISTTAITTGSGADTGYTAVEYSPAFTAFTPATRVTAKTAGHCIMLTLMPESGHTFKPTNISFDAVKVGTDGGNVDVYYKVGTGTETAIATSLAPLRNKITASNSTGYSHYDYTMRDVLSEGGQVFTIYLYIYNLNGADNENSKAIAFRNVNITGVVDERGLVFATDFDNEVTGGIPTGWITLDGSDVHTFGNIYSAGPRLMEGFSGDFTKGLYWRNTSVSFGERVKNWQLEDGSFDPEMPENIALKLDEDEYLISFKMAAWKNEFAFTLTIEDLDGNVYLTHEDIATPNLDAVIGEVTGSEKAKVYFRPPYTGYYILRFSANGDQWQEYILGGVTISKYSFSNDFLNISEDFTLTGANELVDYSDVNVLSGVTLTAGSDIVNAFALNNIDLEMNLFSDSYAQVMSATDMISVTGDLSERIYTQGMTWNFLSLPFDCDLSRLATEDGTAYAIRYYDGASRAANNVAVGNWKDYGKNDIIPMGTGFIYMTQNDTWTQFYAVDNENKNQVFRSTSSSTTLGMQQNESAESAHRGWNLMGNPYANYYSIHATDFDKAVTYWNGETGTYDVCYPSDDDLALKPNQAFFVQCPSGRESITMPGSGRQLTGEISSGAKVRRAQLNAGKDRKLINLTLTDSKFTDKTRVVLNEEAKMDYELECDASKFMSMRNEVPQLYSIGPKSIHYAVNERPLDDGTVKLGVYIPADGDYTINLMRNDAEQVLLTDSETGQTTDLTDGSYSFFAKKGTYNNRLTLTFGTATGIQSPPTPKGGVPCGGEYYDLSGRRISQPAKAGVYLQKQGKMVQKVMVK